MSDSNLIYDKPIVIEGLNAIVFEAYGAIHEMDAPYEPVSDLPKRYWEDATEQERNDENIHWITTQLFGRKAFTYYIRSYTDEELERKTKIEQWRLKEMFSYILENYGWESALAFYDGAWADQFKKYGVVIDTKFPHCKYEYEYEQQCDMSCEYFIEGRCAATEV